MAKKRTSLEIDEEYLNQLKARGMTIKGALIAYLHSDAENLLYEINLLKEGNEKLQRKLTEYAGRIFALEEKQIKQD